MKDIKGNWFRDVVLLNYIGGLWSNSLLFYKKFDYIFYKKYFEMIYTRFSSLVRIISCQFFYFMLY